MHNQGVLQMTDEQWQAIIKNDKSYDNIFIYAVTSTGICCRPSCKSRDPKKENTLIFKDVSEALAKGFRPCKRCKPGGIHLPDEDWIVQIKDYINENYHKPLSLDILADKCHGSPYHLQRKFKKIVGQTPMEYIQQVRISSAMKKLQTTDKSIAEIGFDIGMPNIPYFISLFKNKTGHTPKQYQKLVSRRKDNGKKH